MSAVVWSADASLCAATEKVYFSCKTKSGRLLSVCGSTELQQPDAYVQYRFGPAGKPELAYPANRTGSLQSFRFYHYVRPQVSRVGLTFQSGDYEYTVYDHYEGDIEPAEKSTGVSVTKTGTSNYSDISCTGEIVNKLIDLEKFVPCDPENALSNCEP